MNRVKYRLPLRGRIQRWTWPLLNWLVYKPLVLIYAIKGNYPAWMVTPDDPKSPFGSGTTPGASTEPTVMSIYARFGRYVGDVYWLALRNSGYGLNYRLKPAWLKDPDIKYENLTMDREVSGTTVVYWLLQPDGTWLWETQRKFWIFTLLTGFRIEPIWNGMLENKLLLSTGQPRAKRPWGHPNMEGRPVLSVRTARTL